MRFCVLGLPSRTTDAVVNLCRSLLQVPLSEVLLDDDTSTEEFIRQDWNQANLMVSHFPRKALIDWLTANRLPTIVVAPDIYICLAHAERLMHKNRGLLPGVLSLSLALIASARELPAHLVVTGRQIGSELDELFNFLKFVGADVKDTRIPAEHAIILSLYEVAASEQPLSDVSAVSKESLTDTAQACQGLLTLVRSRNASEISWPVALFFDTETRSRPAPPTVQLEGPARCLYFGPYLHLSISCWEADLSIVIRGKTDPTELRAEFYTESFQTSFPFVLPSAGSYEVQFQFNVQDASQAIQIRFFLDRGEIEGSLHFSGVNLRRINSSIPQSELSG